MRLIGTWLLLSLIACGPNLPRPEKNIPFRESLSYFSSSNGFRVFVLPDAQARVARLELRLEVGAADDPPGMEGMAHLVEHMMYQTLLERPEGPTGFAAALSRVSQGWNAYTTLDSTHFMVQTLPENLDEVFGLEMQRLLLGCRGWDEERFRHEREVVANELREQYRSPSGALGSMLHAALYPEGHPYRRNVGGSIASVQRIELADACEFVERHYTPHRTTIFLVGNVTDEVARRLARRWLAAFPQRQPPPAPDVAPAPAGRRQVVTRTLDVDRPLVFVMFPLPPEGTRAGRMAKFGYDALGSSVGWFARQYDWGKDVRVFSVGGKRAPAAVLGIELDRIEELNEALEATWKSMKWVHRSMAEAGERRDNSRRWEFRAETKKLSLLASFERLEERGTLYGDYVQFDDEPLYLVGRLAELDRTQPHEIRQVAERIFDADNATVLVVVPKQDDKSGHTRSFRYRPTVHGTDYWKVRVDPDEAFRSVALPEVPRRDQVLDYRLDNGARVLLWPSMAIPLVHMHVVIRAGAADDPPGKVGLAGFFGRTTIPDFLRHSSIQLATEIDDTIRILSRWTKPSRVDFAVPRKRLEEKMSDPDATRRRQYLRAFLEGLYGKGHPYASAGLTRESLQNITSDDLRKFYDDNFNAANLAIVITGHMDTELVEQHVRHRFGKLPTGAPTAKRLPEPTLRNDPVYVTGGVEDSPVVEVDLAFAGAPGIGDDHAARLVLAAVLNNELSVLREDLAVTYGANASYEARRGHGYWHVSGRVDAGRIGEAMEATLEVLERMRTDPTSYHGSFVLARRAVVAQLLTRTASAAEVADELSFIARFDLPVSFFDSVAEAAAALRPEDLEAIIDAELQPDRMVLGLWGNPTVTSRGITAARAHAAGPRRPEQPSGEAAE